MSVQYPFTEDEPTDEPDEDSMDDDPINPLVDTLFDEIESLRMQVSLSIFYFNQNPSTDVDLSYSKRK